MGPTVVVTGGSRGIGHAILEAFVADGYAGFSLDLIQPLEPLAGIRYLKVDVADKESVTAAFESISTVDCLVNNAGIQRAGLLGQQDPSDWEKVLATNLTGAYS